MENKFPSVIFAEKYDIEDQKIIVSDSQIYKDKSIESTISTAYIDFLRNNGYFIDPQNEVTFAYGIQSILLTCKKNAKKIKSF